MKNTIRYLSLLVMLCCSIIASGQTQLTLTVSPADAGTVSGSGVYATGRSVTLRATAATGFVFQNWTRTDGTVVSTSANFSYTKQEGDEVLTANFKYQPDTPGEPDTPVFPDKPKKDKYTLTLMASEGGSNLTGAGSYAPATKVSVSVTLLTNYTFLGWFTEQDSLVNSNLKFTYTMGEQDIVLTARFKYSPETPAEPDTPDFPDRPKQPHRISVKALPTEGGTVSVGNSNVTEGNSTNIKATAATNYTFVGWYVADTLFNEKATFSYTMQTKDIEFVAHFKYTPDTPTEPDTPDFPDRPKPQHQITVSAYPTEGGSVSVGSSKVIEGSTTSVKATAATNYTFAGWYVADTLFCEKATFNYTMQTKDIALVAHFRYTPGVPGEPDTPETSRNELFLKSSVRALPGQKVQYPIYLNSSDTLTDIAFNMSFPIGVTPNLGSIVVSEKAVGYTLKCEKLENGCKKRPGISNRRNAEGNEEEAYGSVYAVSLTGGRIEPCGTQLITVTLDVDETFTDSVSGRCGINQISVTNTDGSTETASARHGSMVLREVTEQGTYYYLTVISTGNGTTTVGGKAIRNSLQEIELLEGTSVYAYFAADQGFYLSRVNVDGVNVTEQLTDGRWLVNNITDDVLMEVDYAAVPHVRPTQFTVDGVAYEVTSDTMDVVNVVPNSTINYRGYLTIPSVVTYDDIEWTVTGLADSTFFGCSQLITLSVPATVTSVGNGVFWDCPRLAAVEWLSDTRLADTLWNNNRCVNMLLYVDNRNLAPETVQNVVVAGIGEKIILTDGADFYCPRAFTATQISYMHTYTQQTEISVCRGWESIALPFSATSIRHATQGEIYPFATLTEEDIEAGQRPFWLYEFTADDEWKAATELKAYVPYIISMPNSTAYSLAYRLGGSVTFAAEDAYIETTDMAENVEGTQRWFCPSFATGEAATTDFLLNVAAEYEGQAEGSVFARELRDIRPFEAYFRMESPHETKRFFTVFDDMASGIGNVYDIPRAMTDIMTSGTPVYDLCGRKMGTVKNNTLPALPQGIYIVGGRKIKL